MKEEEFEYGELVEVRSRDVDAWKERHYLDTVKCKETGEEFHWAYFHKQGPGNHNGTFVKWKQIRKLQKPEPIEHWVGRIQTQVMSLMDRVGEIEDGLQPDPDYIGIEQPETIEQRMDKFEAIFNAVIKNFNEKFQSIDKQLK